MSMSQVFGAPAWGLNAGHLSKHGCSSGGSPFGDHYDSMTPSKQVGSNANIFGSGSKKSAWNHDNVFGGGSSNKDANNNKGGSKNDRNSSGFGGGPSAQGSGHTGGEATAASSNPWGEVYKSRQHFNDMHFC